MDTTLSLTLGQANKRHDLVRVGASGKGLGDREVKSGQKKWKQRVKPAVNHSANLIQQGVFKRCYMARGAQQAHTYVFDLR